MQITSRIGIAKTQAVAFVTLFALALVPATVQAGAAAATGALRVWSSDIHDREDGEQGNEPPAISLVGARNGAFSGKVVVGSGAIQGLKTAMSELKQEAGAIPSSNISVRYGAPWERGLGSKGNDILLETPLDSFSGMVPVFVTVRVPKDAKPGVYTGNLSIQAQALGPVNVPVKINVQDWTLPDTQDYRTWIELLQSPDTLALEYGVPLWSDKHWEMIAQSFDMIGQTGSRVVYVPLICRTNYGNEESMVRWVKKGENQYDHDFSVMDKYLDVAEKNLGKPKIVIFFSWDIYLMPPPAKIADAPWFGTKGEGSWWAERQKLFKEGKGPPVTVLDPVAKKTETVYLPRYEKPESKALWQPLWTQLRERMTKRGLEKTMMLGMMSDWRPGREEAAFLKEVSGGLPWTSCSHHVNWLSSPKPTWNGDPIGYTQAALEFFYVINPAITRSYGWKHPVLHGVYWRMGYRYLGGTQSIIRQEPECNITGKQRGIAHLGADFWPAIKNKAGRRVNYATDRYPESHWHSLDVGSYMLAPGQTGPVGTSRLEVFKEGIQECEARIAIESILTDEAQKTKLGAELANRAQEVLDERHLWLWKAQGALAEDLKKVGMITSYQQYDYEFMNADRKSPKPWKVAEGNKDFIHSGWAERTGKLFATAGEVQKKMAGN